MEQKFYGNDFFLFIFVLLIFLFFTSVTCQLTLCSLFPVPCPPASNSWTFRFPVAKCEFLRETPRSDTDDDLWSVEETTWYFETRIIQNYDTSYNNFTHFSFKCVFSYWNSQVQKFLVRSFLWNFWIVPPLFLVLFDAR